MMMKRLEHCPECGLEEAFPMQHKMDCSSKKVFDAYLTLRDYPITILTDDMLRQLSFKVWMMQMDREYRELEEE